jgi:hypothetical protein
LEAATQGVVLLQNGIQKSTSLLATHEASPTSPSASSPLAFSASPAPVLPLTNLGSQKVALFGPVAKDEGVRPLYTHRRTHPHPEPSQQPDTFTCMHSQGPTRPVSPPHPSRAPSI